MAPILVDRRRRGGSVDRSAMDAVSDPPALSPVERSERVKGLALALGFDLAGVAPARPAPENAFLEEWLARGYAGEMHYLERRAAVRSESSKPTYNKRGETRDSIDI